MIMISAGENATMIQFLMPLRVSKDHHTNNERLKSVQRKAPKQNHTTPNLINSESTANAKQASANAKNCLLSLAIPGAVNGCLSLLITPHLWPFA